MTFRPGVTVVVNDVADNCVKADGITVLGGYIWAKTSAEAGKCLSSDADITISGGTLKLYTSGNAIYEEDVDHALKDAQDLDSYPKGVRAEGEIIINGGSLNIQVTGRSDGSEGLESKSKITVNDGEIFVYAYDDAINVGGDHPVGIEVNGGKIFAFADNNDGIDSNAMMWINGGTLIGTGGAAVYTSTSSTQRSVIYNGVSAKTGELFVITDADGQPILKYELPRTMNSMAIFFSSPDIRQEATYTVYSGGSLSGNTVNWNGWFEDGCYTQGTKPGTFTSSNINTTVGQGNGPGGGPGNGGFGPGWWN